MRRPRCNAPGLNVDQPAPKELRTYWGGLLLNVIDILPYPVS